MRNRKSSTNGGRWRGIAITATIVAISLPAAFAQTTLRFVGPENGQVDARNAAQPVERVQVSATTVKPTETELRVLNVSEGKYTSKIQVVTGPTTITPAVEGPKAAAIVAASPNGDRQTQLRFLADAKLPEAKATQPTVVQTPVAASELRVESAPARSSIIVSNPMSRANLPERSLITVIEPVPAPVKPLPLITPIEETRTALLPEPKPIAVKPHAEKALQRVAPEARIAAAPRDSAPSLETRNAPKTELSKQKLVDAPKVAKAKVRSGTEMFHGLPQIAAAPVQSRIVVEPQKEIVLKPSHDAAGRMAAQSNPRVHDGRPLIELFVEALPVKAQPRQVTSPLFDVQPANPKSAMAKDASIAKTESKYSIPVTLAPPEPSRVATAFDNLKAITPVPLPATKDQWQPAETIVVAPRPIAAPKTAPILANAAPIRAASEPAKSQPIAAKPTQVVEPKTFAQVPVTPIPSASKPEAAPAPAKLVIAPAKPQIVAQPIAASPTAKTPVATPNIQLAPRPEVAMLTPAAQPASSNVATINEAFSSGLAAGPNFPQAAIPTVDVPARTTAKELPVAPGNLSNNYSYVATTNPAASPQYRFFMATETKPGAAFEPTAGELNTPPGEAMSATMVPGQLPCNCETGACTNACPYGPGQSGTRYICGLDCGQHCASCDARWRDERPIPWSLFGPGEYVGPPRPEHVSTYYLRVNDFLTLTFIESRQKSSERYRIGVGDRLRAEWLPGNNNADAWLNREVIVQPDGSVTLPMVGEVSAAGKTINEFQAEVAQLYGKYQRDPQITITPLETNVGVQDILKAVIGRNASAGQVQELRVTPEGTIQAAGLGSVYVQGLTLDELRSELEARYAAKFGPGLMITPALTEHATNYIFMGGEVRVPGRYTLEGPTTVMQAISMAGGWNNGGNLCEVVIFRRDENWCLKATKVNLRPPFYGNDPCPTNDVWLRDNDLVIVPKSRILCATDVINLYFTRGIYAVFPITYVYDFSANSAITPVP